MPVALDCEACGADWESVELAQTLPDTRRRLRCRQCGHEWLRGTPTPQRVALPSLAELKSRFPKPGDVDAENLARADMLKTEFLRRSPQPAPDVAPYWAKYQQIFSANGLVHAAPQDLKDFANSNIGANPGNMSVFNDTWNQIGAHAAATQVKASIEYLLRDPQTTPLEDRLTDLINDTKSFGMKGFKEALLTKVLCIAYPDRYLTILKYTGEAGKREIARSVWGLELPDPQKVHWTIGRLIIWSNDLLLALIGDGFETQQHAAAFLWWAKDQA